jgi:glutaredoxin 3
MNEKPRIRIYGSDYCGYCVAARMLLDRKGLRYEDIPVGADDELRKVMEKESGGRTIPQIFVDDVPIGGFDELNAMNMSGELDRMLGIDERA